MLDGGTVRRDRRVRHKGQTGFFGGGNDQRIFAEREHIVMELPAQSRIYDDTTDGRRLPYKACKVTLMTLRSNRTHPSTSPCLMSIYPSLSVSFAQRPNPSPLGQTSPLFLSEPDWRISFPPSKTRMRSWSTIVVIGTARWWPSSICLAWMPAEMMRRAAMRSLKYLFIVLGGRGRLI
jgi:hypothetical protein